MSIRQKKHRTAAWFQALFGTLTLTFLANPGYAQLARQKPPRISPREFQTDEEAPELLPIPEESPEPVKTKPKEENTVPDDSTNAVSPSDRQSTSDVSNEQEFPGACLLNSRPPFLVGISVDHRDRVYREFETLSVEFKAEKEAYLYLLYHQANNACNLLYPNDAKLANRIVARETVRVPNDDSFRFRIRGPFGEEYLQVLAATQPLPELDSLVRQSESPMPVVTEPIIASLRKRLENSPRLWTEHRLRILTEPGQSAPAELQQPRRFGLFIGVGEFNDNLGIDPHVHPGQSAQLIRGEMLEKCQLPEERTKLLVNTEATREAIRLEIFDWLSKATDPGDIVFLYFAGHAAQTANHDGSEVDGRDEALLPFDGQVDDNGQIDPDTVILDDTLARWLEELGGRQVVLILDTSHGAGVVDGSEITKSFMKEASRVKDIAQVNTIVITSAGADELANFQRTPDNTMWFTHFLIQAIRDADKPLTVIDAFTTSRIAMLNMFGEGDLLEVQDPTIHSTIEFPVMLVP